jgi:hypothetical protein
MPLRIPSSHGSHARAEFLATPKQTSTRCGLFSASLPKRPSIRKTLIEHSRRSQIRANPRHVVLDVHVMRFTQDELLHGVIARNGARQDRGCGINSWRDLQNARKSLVARGWLRVDGKSENLLYELCLGGDHEVVESASIVVSPVAPSVVLEVGAKLSKYQRGPLDRFQVPKGDNDGTGGAGATGNRFGGNRAER